MEVTLCLSNQDSILRTGWHGTWHHICCSLLFLSLCVSTPFSLLGRPPPHPRSPLLPWSLSAYSHSILTIQA